MLVICFTILVIPFMLVIIFNHAYPLIHVYHFFHAYYQLIPSSCFSLRIFLSFIPGCYSFIYSHHFHPSCSDSHSSHSIFWPLTLLCPYSLLSSLSFCGSLPYSANLHLAILYEYLRHGASFGVLKMDIVSAVWERPLVTISKFSRFKVLMKCFFS